MVIQLSQQDIHDFYVNRYKFFEMTWSDYFHYAIFDKNHTEWQSALENTIDILARNMSLNADHTLLDLGSGIGSSSLYVGKKIGCKITGIDQVSGQVAYAQMRAQDQLLKNISFLKASGDALPFDNNSFDRCMSSEVLCHIEEKEPVLKEVYRVLKPKGLFAFTDMIEINKPSGNVLDFFCEYTHQPQPMPSLEEYKNLLESQGFVVEGMIDNSHQLKGNYEKATEFMESNMPQLEFDFGQAEIKDTQEFYKYCLRDDVLNHMGWAMFICSKG